MLIGKKEINLKKAQYRELINALSWLRRYTYPDHDRKNPPQEIVDIKKELYNRGYDFIK